MPDTIIDLGKKVKAKYPGQYDDMDDADLGRRVKTKYPGAYDDFQDVATTPAASPAPQKALPASQSPEFQLMFGASPADTVERAKGVGRAVGKAGMSAIQYVQHLLGRPVSPTPLFLEPSMDPNQRVGEMVGEAALTAAPALATGGASLPVRAAAGSITGGLVGGPTGAVVGGAIPVAGQAVSGAVKTFMDKLPSKARAGAKFQQVMSKAQDVPIGTAQAQQIAGRAQELKEAGASMPKVISDFMKNRKKATGDFMTQPVAEPMTYRTGRDFASNAGALSAKETTRLSPQMQSQVSQFAKAMKDANREAAAKVGMGDLYDQAMKEYAKAASLEAKTEIVKKWAVRAGAAALLGGAGVTGARVAGLD